MEITKEVRGNRLCVSLAGELDQHAAGNVREQMDSLLLADTRLRELRLDLSGVTFMDSSGLGVILGRYRIVSERGGRLVIAGTSKYAERILRMAGIYALVEKGEQ